MSKTPIVIDLETRSSCDLRARGGYEYARDPSTRLLTVAWRVDGEDHVWFPGAEGAPEAFVGLHLPGVTAHWKEREGRMPRALADLLDRPWVGHNCDTFDRLVWREKYQEPVEWVDTYPLALSVGLPGGLKQIGLLLWGEGKYEEGSKLMLKHSKCESEEDCESDNVPVGAQVLIAKYNVQDVRLTDALLGVCRKECKNPPFEARVYAAHRAVNDRGVRVDRGLLHAMIALDKSARADAVKQIRALTGGKLDGEHALRSRPSIFGWLDHMGVNLGTSLRKNIVERWVETNRDAGDVNEPDGEIDESEAVPSNLALVIRVLELRASALRITGGKLDAALNSIMDDDYVRGLHVYHAGHTGRWAARRIQTHNLPRPKPGVDTWALVGLFERTGRLDLDAVSALCDPNDAASALLRSLFLPDAGLDLADADLSQIEARLLAWLADEGWLVQAFWTGEDPYIKMAEAIAGPKEKWPNPDGLPYKKHEYRQNLGKVPELACGYQMGPAKLALYAAAMGVNMRDYDTDEQACVTAYRRTHPAIAGHEAGEYKGRPYFRGGLWDRLNDAAVDAATNGEPTSVGPIEFSRDGPGLVMTLPSGRRFVYRDARVEDRPYFNKTVKAVTYHHPRYGRQPMYGGKWAENVIQAMGRDCIANAIVNVEARGIPSCLHVHDSVAGSIVETRFDEFMRAVTTRPDWLTDFPLDAEGSCASRWAKSPPPGVKESVYRNGEKLK